MPSDVLAWLLAISPIPAVLLPGNWFVWVILLLAVFDVDRFVKNAYVVREQLLAKSGCKPIALRLWAIFVYPVYLFKRAKLLGKKQTQFIVWCIVFPVCLVIAIGKEAMSSGNSQAVLAVREGALDSHPDMTLGQALESFISDVKWESLVADDGKTYVNAKGGIAFQGKPATALVQYRLDDGRFQYQAFAINGVEQPYMRYLELIEKAYGEAHNKQVENNAPLNGEKAAISGNYGTRKMFNGTELYYTSAVTEKEADKLGAWLISQGIANGDRKTVQLDKSGSTYELKLVVKKGLEQDQEYADGMKEIGMYLRGVFNGANVDVHLCDERLQTLRVVPAPDWDNHDDE